MGAHKRKHAFFNNRPQQMGAYSRAHVFFFISNPSKWEHTQENIQSFFYKQHQQVGSHIRKYTRSLMNDPRK